MVKLFKPNAYKAQNIDWVGKNSEAIKSSEFVSKASWVVSKTVAGGTIEGLSLTEKTFASDNQTVAKDTVVYELPTSDTLYEIPVSWETITFSWALVTSNVINLKVNGTAMTQVAFDTNDATTLAAIATQLVTDFPTLIASASAGTNSVKVTPVTTNSSVSITNVVVTWGAWQATATVSLNTIAYTDEGKFYDLTTTGQSINYHTAHASSGQVLLKRAIAEGTFGVVTVANT